MSTKTRKFEVGDKVDYHSIIGGPVTSTGHTIRHIGRISSYKDEVAWLTGKAGCVFLGALSFADDPKEVDK